MTVEIGRGGFCFSLFIHLFERTVSHLVTLKFSSQPVSFGVRFVQVFSNGNSRGFFYYGQYFEHPSVLRMVRFNEFALEENFHHDVYAPIKEI